MVITCSIVSGGDKMALLDPDLVINFLHYGFLALGFGILIVGVLELIAYGVFKAMSFFRL